MKKSLKPEQTLHQAMSSFKSLASPPSEPKHPIREDEFVPACQFITQLVTQANQYGSSLVRLQYFISHLPQLFGFHGVMLPASPFFFFEFWRPGDHDPSRVIVRQPAGSFDLAKLSAVGVLVNEMAEGKVSFADGSARLKEIDSSPQPYRASIVAAGYALCGAGFAVLLSASWWDVALAALLSLLVYAITVTADRSQWLAIRINFTAALVASLLANLLALVFPGSDASVVALCALIVLVPGLSLTLGTAELASRLTVPGINRLVDGILVTFALVVGVAVGSAPVRALWSVSAPATAAVRPLWITLPSVIVLMLGLALVFQVRRRDLGWVILAGGLAYLGVQMGNRFGDWQGAFLGALFLGIYTALYTMRLRRPGSVVILPGVMILVPGVAAYFGLNTLQTSGIFGALPAVWGVVVQITAIIGGLFIAASILPQKASL